MKLFIIVTFLSLTLSSAFLLRPPAETKTESTDKPVDCPSKGIYRYFTTLFHSFELGRPKQLLKCFEGHESKLYFKYLSDFTALVVDAENRKFDRIHQDWSKLGKLGQDLQPLWHCMVQTKDFGDLLEALGDKYRDPTAFALVNYIYMQAGYGKLAEVLPPVDKAIQKGEYCKAGWLKADVLRGIADEVKRKGLSLVSLKGFWNGVHVGLDLPDAKSIYKCWDNHSAAIRLEFLYGMSKAVAEGKVNEAAMNAVDWYNKEGQKIMNKITSKHWQCWKSADDTKSESKKVGVDITDQDFYEKMFRFIRIHQDEFWKFQSVIKENFEKYNFIHAGMAHGKFVEAIANQL